MTTPEIEKVCQQFSRLGKPLLPHQQQCLTWMVEREGQGTGGLICDDPGLGKTYQALSLILTDPNPKHSHLIIVPSSIVQQWRLAAEELFPASQVYVYHGPKRLHFREGQPRMVITSYEVVRDDVYLQPFHWHRIIVDEIHKMKNSSSKTSQVLMTLKSHYRWGLTGTPIQNKVEEIANLFRFITGTRRLNDHQLTNLIHDGLLRRRKQEVLGDLLPPVDIEITEVPFSSEPERQFYQKVQNNVRREFQELMALGGEARDENVALFELLIRLRQATQHPQLVLNGFTRKFLKKHRKKMAAYQGTSSKHQALCQMLEADRQPAIVFCHFREEMDILERQLKMKGYSCQRFDGKTSVEAKKNLITNLTRPTFPLPEVLLVQISAGGVGLNLQRYSRVYLMSMDWNPSNEIQAIARAHRLGQRQPVQVKRLVLVDPREEFSTIDRRILEIQDQKRNLMADVLVEPELREQGQRRKFTLGKGDYSRLLV